MIYNKNFSKEVGAYEPVHLFLSNHNNLFLTFVFIYHKLDLIDSKINILQNKKLFNFKIKMGPIKLKRNIIEQ